MEKPEYVSIVSKINRALLPELSVADALRLAEVFGLLQIWRCANMIAAGGMAGRRMRQRQA